MRVGRITLLVLLAASLLFAGEKLWVPPHCFEYVSFAKARCKTLPNDPDRMSCDGVVVKFGCVSVQRQDGDGRIDVNVQCDDPTKEKRKK